MICMNLIRFLSLQTGVWVLANKSLYSYMSCPGIIFQASLQKRLPISEPLVKGRPAADFIWMQVSGIVFRLVYYIIYLSVQVTSTSLSVMNRYMPVPAV